MKALESERITSAVTAPTEVTGILITSSATAAIDSAIETARLV